MAVHVRINATNVLGGGPSSQAAGVSHCEDATAFARRERVGAVLVPPPVEFARRNSLHLAYQRSGDGPFDLVFVAGAMAISLRWEEPEPAREPTPHGELRSAGDL